MVRISTPELAEDPQLLQMDIPEESVAHGQPTLKETKRVRRKKQQLEITVP